VIKGVVYLSSMSGRWRV